VFFFFDNSAYSNAPGITRFLVWHQENGYPPLVGEFIATFSSIAPIPKAILPLCNMLILMSPKDNGLD